MKTYDEKFETDLERIALNYRTFRITEQNNYILKEAVFVDATNHKLAINQIDKNVKWIFNKRFREIERTGHFYYVEDCYKINGKTFIFEVN